MRSAEITGSERDGLLRMVSAPTIFKSCLGCACGYGGQKRVPRPRQEYCVVVASSFFMRLFAGELSSEVELIATSDFHPRQTSLGVPSLSEVNRVFGLRGKLSASWFFLDNSHGLPITEQTRTPLFDWKIP